MQIPNSPSHLSQTTIFEDDQACCVSVQTVVVVAPNKFSIKVNIAKKFSVSPDKHRQRCQFRNKRPLQCPLHIASRLRLDDHQPTNFYSISSNSNTTRDASEGSPATTRSAIILIVSCNRLLVHILLRL